MTDTPQSLPFEIKHRWSERVLFSSPTAKTVREAVLEAVKTGAVLRGAVLRGAVLSDADLRGADLSDAVLSDADLRGAVLRGAVLRGAVLRGAVLRGAVLRGAVLSDADLRGAVLSDADLRGAVLSDADLRGAVLSDADLRGADLSGADLRGADLSGADLSGAVLSDADLSGADLSGADLSGAVLTPIRRDVELILYENPREATALLGALEAGRVDGSCYTGDCCCLVGTIAKARGCSVDSLVSGRDSTRPAERWFMAIKPGDTPDKSNVTKLTVEWVRAWMARQPVEAVGP